MLVELDLEGARLFAHGEELVVGTDKPLTEVQRQHIKDNKPKIMAELRALETLELSQADDKTENLINSLEMYEDRAFVRQCLAGISGGDRATLVNEYLNQWRLGVEAEPVAIKQDNAGRHRANVWIREKKFN